MIRISVASESENEEQNMSQKFRIGILPRENQYIVEWDDLYGTVPPYNISFSTVTASANGKKALGLVIREGRGVFLPSHETRGRSRRTLAKQLIPTFYTWYLENEEGEVTHTWWAQFMQNPDLTYYTTVKLPEEDLRRSWLRIFFNNLGEKGERAAFHLDMTDYDWRGEEWPKVEMRNVVPGGHKLVANEEYVVRREDLNTPVSPYDIYFHVTTFGGKRERSVTVVILQDEPYYSDEGISWRQREKQREKQRPDQLVPHSYHWYIKTDEGEINHKWMAYFMYSRQHTYRTAVRLPKKDLERSWLEIYFRDINGEGEGISFHLDMTEYDWTPTNREIEQ